jgi:geranylgeranyl pyrophosphate synthase
MFQITDDLLDVCGDSAALGKRAGKDAKRGKLTFPGILGVEESLSKARRLVDEACLALEPLRPRADALQALAWWVLERSR